MSRPEAWRKSTFSGGGQDGDCVELSNRGDVRDSKNPTARLTLGKAATARLVERLKVASD